MKRLIHIVSPMVAAALLMACGPSTGSADNAALAEVAQAAARGEDRVSPKELAEWLIEERQDFVLIDVRSTDDFAQGAIADATNTPLARLVTAEEMAALPDNRKIVVYSNGSENAAKAAVMLRLAGYDARLLAGGYNAWHAQVLNPDIPLAEVRGESLQISEQRAYACYFVGERSGASARPEDLAEPFVPPVFTEEEELEPPPVSGTESC